MATPLFEASVPRIIETVAAGIGDELVAFCQRLVQTPSLPGEEGAVQDVMAEEMARQGLQVERIPVDYAALAGHPAFSDDGQPPTGRSVVVGRQAGVDPSGAGRSLILNGHVDVVSPGDLRQWDQDPWSGAVRHGRLHGRGACDMKAGLAAGLYALVALREAGLAPRHDVLLQSVIGEESGGVGTLAAIAAGSVADAALILEPTSLTLCPVQCGALTFRLRVPGVSAHGATRQVGVSAIDNYVVLHQAILALEHRRLSGFAHPFFDEPRWAAPISIGCIHGGTWPSSVPDEVIAEGRMGVLPGESVATARRDFESAVSAAAAAHPFLANHPAQIEWVEGQFESGETPGDHPFVHAVAAAHARVFGTPPRIAGVPWGADLRLFTNHAGMPCALYGPGDILLAHAPNESVALDEVFAAVRAIATLITLWCGVEQR